MELLRGQIRPYAWGSHSAIARIQGRPEPTTEPEAELWLGAHPDSPSTVLRSDAGGAGANGADANGADGNGGGREVSLAELIAEQPAELLGPAVLAEFGGRLPFLVKLLAAAAPLSLQAHPDAAYARAAYAAQQARGDAEPAYTDPYHKPEMLVALTDFEALCGFQAPERSAELLARLGVPALAPVLSALAAPDPTDALRGAVEALLRWPQGERAGLIAAGVAGARAGAAGAPELALLPDLAARYPEDPGVLVALLLNQVHLAPGQAIWMPAGNLHAYLRGTGVELLASSDNVLRGGLTVKPVNVPELLRVLRFEVLGDPLLPAAPVAPGVTTWPVPVRDFALYRAEPDGSPLTVPVAGPAIVLCVAGSVRVDDGAGAVVLDSGAAGLAAAGAKPLQVSGAGTAFVATTGG